MAVKIRNRSRHLVIVELNTRETIHLAPNEVSRTLEDYEVGGNAQLEKLARRDYIEKLPEESGAQEGASRKKAQRST